MEYFIGFVVGVVVGAGIVLAVHHLRGRAGKRELQQMRETFSALAGEALDANARRLTESAAAQLDGKKELIDQAVKAVQERLEQVRQFVQRVEAVVQRLQRFGGSVGDEGGKFLLALGER